MFLKELQAVTHFPLVELIPLTNMNNLRKASGIIFLISLVLLIDAWFKQKPKIIDSAPKLLRKLMI